MIQPTHRAALAQWLLRSTFPRFVVIGATAFLVDFVMLELLTRAFGMGPISARVFSFGAALTCNFLLSRFWGFREHRSERALPEAVRFVGVQLTGGLLNFLTYTVTLLLVPALETFLFLPLALGSAVGLVFNYAGARLFVFRGR